MLGFWCSGLWISVEVQLFGCFRASLMRIKRAHSVPGQWGNLTGALMLTISLNIHRRYQISNIKSGLRSGNLIVIFLCLLMTGDLSCSLWSFFASYSIPRHDPSKLMLSVLPRQASPEITYFSFTLLPYIITLFVAHCFLNCTNLTLCNVLSLANLGTGVIFWKPILLKPSPHLMLVTSLVTNPPRYSHPSLLKSGLRSRDNYFCVICLRAAHPVENLNRTKSAYGFL